MSEFISLKEAIATVKEAYENDELFEGYEYRLNELPSTEIIHCRECRFGEVDNDPCLPEQYFCHYHGCDWNLGDHFCGYAELREGEVQ